jgi:NDP-sugar pyrophosphorylase family protein
MIPVILQAGGKGSRLQPYTTVIPKPLMPVGEMPIIEIVVQQLARTGVRKIFITLGHFGNLIKAFLGNGDQWGVEIVYVHEGKPLGTVGPIRQISCPETHFFVMNGDILTDLDYKALYDHHMASNSLLTVAVSKQEVPVSLGVIEFNEEREIVGFREKPTLSFWASMGIYVFSPEVWKMVPENCYFGFDSLMERILSNGLVANIFQWNGLWLDIGTPEDFARATRVFEDNRSTFLK